MNVLILIILIFFDFSRTGSAIPQDNWGQRLLNSPATMFTNAYEKQIFFRLCEKLAPLQIVGVRSEKDRRIINCKILNGGRAYQLVAEMDEQNRVRRLFRLVMDIDFESNIDRNTPVTEWLGQFLYRLDAGDSAALHDMMFHNRVKVKYDNISEKSELLTRLIRDFPQIIEPSQIQVSKQFSLYRIYITNTFLGSLLIEIPESMLKPRNTAELQATLHTRLEQSLRKKTTEDQAKPSSREELVQKMRTFYPGVKSAGDTIKITYPYHRLKLVREMAFVVTAGFFEDKAGAEEIHVPLNLLFEQETSTIIINKALPISIYIAQERIESVLDEIVTALEYNYKLWLPLVESTKRHHHSGMVHYRGYEKHDIKISNNQFTNLQAFLYNEGSVYYYPSKIDITQNTINVKGLLYILRQDENYYHFAELKQSFPRDRTVNSDNFIFTIYPFIPVTELMQ